MTNPDADPSQWQVSPAWYPALLTKVGPPLSDAEIAGYTLTRRFQHADGDRRSRQTPGINSNATLLICTPFAAEGSLVSHTLSLRSVRSRQRKPGRGGRIAGHFPYHAALQAPHAGAGGGKTGERHAGIKEAFPCRTKSIPTPVRNQAGAAVSTALPEQQAQRSVCFRVHPGRVCDLCAGMQIVQNLAIMGTDWVKVDVLDRLRRGMPINPVEAHRVQQIWSLSASPTVSLCLLQGWCS